MEGGEGVGKSTLIKLLTQRLETKGFNVLTTREPGGTLGSEAIRKLLLDPPAQQSWSALTQTLLFYAARRDHLERVIVPALDRGKWVLCDRFSDSTRAYQAAADGLDSKIVDALDDIAVNQHQPDLTLVLDLPVSVAAERRRERNGDLDAFESRDPEFHEKVRDAFLDLVERFPERCKLINADQTPQELADQCMNCLEEAFL